MTFVAFLIWVVIAAGTGYILWKLVFQGRIGKKEEMDPMAVKTSQPDTETTEEGKEVEFRSDVVEAPEEPPSTEEETLEEPEVIEEEEELEVEVEMEEEEIEERTEEPDKEK